MQVLDIKIENFFLAVNQSLTSTHKKNAREGVDFVGKFRRIFVFSAKNAYAKYTRNIREIYAKKREKNGGVVFSPP